MERWIKHDKIEDHPTTLKPLRNTVLVKLDDVAEKSTGGIILTQDTREKEKGIAMSGLLIKIGPNAWEDIGEGAPQVQPGQRVRCVRYGGVMVKDPVSDEEFHIMNDEDLIAAEG